MAAIESLKIFTVEPDGTGFRLLIEDGAGRRLALSATREQIDVIADTLDDLLAEDDTAGEAADGGFDGHAFGDEDDDEAAPQHR